MGNIEMDFYSGFEDEQEIEFFSITNLGMTKIRMWIGYFRMILRQIKTPPDTDWIGLVYYDNLLIGWHEEKNWQIPCLEEVLLQLQVLRIPIDDPVNNMDYEPVQKILIEMINIVSEGIDKCFPVYINKC
jgi:hypothetical protein